MEENVSEIKEKFKTLIKNKSGMLITEVHFRQLEKYLDDTVAATGVSYTDLYQSVLTNHEKLIDLINAVAVNETYFFREEKQFRILKEYIQQNFAGRSVVIWSAASSSGEEAYSLASLAIGCNANPIVYATDIDTDALMKLKTGVYGQNSFRADGKEFMEYLNPYLSESTNKLGQKIYAISPNLKEKIICGRTNLMEINESSFAPKDETVDIIFIRNVFIYFDNQTRNNILRSLVPKLKKGGLLFFSISEIAGIFPNEAGVPLQKESKNSIYYFIKNDAAATNEAYDFLLKKREEQKRKLESEQRLLNIKKIVNEQKQSAETTNRKIEEKQNAEIKKETVLSAEEIWGKLSSFVERKDFINAQQIVTNFNPSVNENYLKYYFMGFLEAAQNNKAAALNAYDKAGISNPHFWPAFFQIAFLHQNPADNIEKKARYNALVKTATIIEENEQENERYSWLLGSFSSSYFFRLCNDFLKKEWN